jgi:quinoprotein glucose dehydrogenase
MMLRTLLPTLLAGIAAAQSTEWPMYGHDPGGARFSPLKQITPQNVGTLKRAWVYKTGENGNFETTPIVVGGVMYLSTQAQRIVALEPETGKEIWSYNPKSRRRELRAACRTGRATSRMARGSSSERPTAA